MSRDKRSKNRRVRSHIKRKAAEDGRESLLKRLLGLPVFLLAAFLTADYLGSFSTNVSDFDYFYHLRHAALYAEEGIATQEFPWVAFSVISRLQADIWYGFHLLLIPITASLEPVQQIRLTPILLLTLFLVLFFLAARRARLAVPFVWPFFMLFGATILVERLMQARPNLLSMGLSALLLVLIVEGNLWGVFLASLGLSFFHLSFFWLGALIWIAAAAIDFARHKTIKWKQLAVMLGGVVVGWLMRPNPLGAAKILYVQLITLVAEKQKGLAGFGSELSRLEPKSLVLLAPFIAVWLASTIWFLYTVRKRRLDINDRSWLLLWSSLLLSIFFFLTTLLMFQRNIDQWSLFSSIFVATVFTQLLCALEAKYDDLAFRRKRLYVMFIGTVLVCAMAGFSIYTYRLFIRGPRVGRAFRHQEAAIWLKENAAPGEIVFHPQWNYFPDLFFWNSKNYYIGGMDPVFQYAYDPSLYWKARHLATNAAGARTWGSAEVEGAVLEDTYAVLRRDFNASYLFVHKYSSPKLYLFAQADSRFTKRFEDRLSAVFELADSEESGDNQLREEGSK